MLDSKILVIGGAGFVGSNLCFKLLEYKPSEIIVVDNLLSSDANNVIINDKVKFIYGSISDDKILLNLPVDFDYIFHLATYHGNQSSIHDPLANHENNTLTTLKICEHLTDNVEHVRVAVTLTLASINLILKV